MLSSSRFNYLVEIAQKLKQTMNRMMAAYSEFPKLIEEEHKMIFSHTYTARLEAICSEKTKLSEDITQAFEEMQQLSQQIYNIWGDLECEGIAAYPGDLSNCIQMLENIHTTLVSRGTSFSLSILENQITGLKNEFIYFKSAMKQVKPKIELNRSALTGVVRSYQDSTRVLIELCEQAQSTYSPQGTQKKPSGGTSTIYVRA
jgi:FlgN protein